MQTKLLKDESNLKNKTKILNNNSYNTKILKILIVKILKNNS